MQINPPTSFRPGSPFGKLVVIVLVCSGALSCDQRSGTDEGSARDRSSQSRLQANSGEAGPSTILHPHPQVGDSARRARRELEIRLAKEQPEKILAIALGNKSYAELGITKRRAVEALLEHCSDISVLTQLIAETEGNLQVDIAEKTAQELLRRDNLPALLDMVEELNSGSARTIALAQAVRHQVSESGPAAGIPYLGEVDQDGIERIYAYIQGGCYEYYRNHPEIPPELDNYLEYPSGLSEAIAAGYFNSIIRDSDQTLQWLATFESTVHSETIGPLLTRWVIDGKRPLEDVGLVSLLSMADHHGVGSQVEKVVREKIHRSSPAARTYFDRWVEQRDR